MTDARKSKKPSEAERCDPECTLVAKKIRTLELERSHERSRQLEKLLEPV